MKRTFKITVVLLILLLSLGGCAPEKGKTEGNEEPVTLNVGLMGKSVKPVGTIVAYELGYFEEEGINVVFQSVSGMNDAYLAVARGELDVYLFSSTAAATFIAQGTTTLRVFGGTAAEGSEIMAAKGILPLTSADDLIGKTVAVQMPETGQMVLKNYLLENGYTIGAPGEDAQITFVYVNDGNTSIEGCVKGEYDYSITNSCLGYYADSFGAELIGTVKQFVDPYPCCRQTCYEGTYENNFDALVAFEIATLRGYKYYKDNMESTLDIMEGYTGQNRDYLQAQLYGTDSYTPAMRLTLDPDKKACIAFYEAMMNIGEIEDRIEIDWNDYVVTDVYETALRTLIERGPS